MQLLMYEEEKFGMYEEENDSTSSLMETTVFLSLSRPVVLIISLRGPASPFISDANPVCRKITPLQITPGMASRAFFRFFIDCAYRLSLVRGTFLSLLHAGLAAGLVSK